MDKSLEIIIDTAYKKVAEYHRSNGNTSTDDFDYGYWCGILATVNVLNEKDQKPPYLYTEEDLFTKNIDSGILDT